MKKGREQHEDKMKFLERGEPSSFKKDEKHISSSRFDQKEE